MTEAMIVSEVFYDIMERRTTFNVFEDRLEMQKIVYLLYEFGVSCGDFSFRWYKHGPYSQRLQNVMLANNADNDDLVTFSDNGKEALSKVKKLLNVPHGKYNNSNWLEALGSILYLKKHIRPEDDSVTIVDELIKQKSHLDDKKLNEAAYNALVEIGLIE